MPAAAQPEAPIGPRRGPGGGLLVTDLLLDLGEMLSLLEDEVTRGTTLDAYLLCCGALQIVEDTGLAGVRASRWAHRLRAGDRVSSAAGAFVRRASSLAAARRETGPTGAWVRAAEAALRPVADALAACIVTGQAGTPSLTPGDLDAIRALAPEPGSSDRDAVGRLPSCFRSFDMHQDDVRELARRFVATRGDGRPAVVVGVRTSGSYLAPLTSAALQAEGLGDVTWVTIRPHQPATALVMAAVGAVVAARGWAIVVDDPPASGAACAAVATQLVDLGVPRGRVVPLLPLLPQQDRLPPALSSYPAVTLAWDDWSLHPRLEQHAVRSRLESLLDAVEITPLPVPSMSSPRGHLRRVFRVRDRDGAEHDVAVEGSGLGYLGRHALAVASALPEWTPRVYGHADGLLYREWLPEHDRLRAPGRAETAGVAAYLDARRRRLAAARDKAQECEGRLPAWEAASLVLEDGFGRLRLPARALALRPLCRATLRATAPAIVDGRTALESFFRTGGPTLCKPDFAEGAFSHLDLWCYDLAYDLAGVAPGARDARLPRTLLGEWEARMGEPIEPDRWLLYQLVHLWNTARLVPALRADAMRASARASQRYFAQRYLSDLAGSVGGPLCLIDVDGVLETDRFGFPAPNRTSMLALRALVAHGYQPATATGRSRDEVRERCEAYGLTAGVAEYGAAVVSDAGDYSSDAIASVPLSAVRDVVERSGACVDEDYAGIVRAFVVDSDGRRRGLDRGTVERVVGAGDVWPVLGIAQTDFVPTGVDKGTGAKWLALKIDAPVAFAIGDQAADLPMLAVADQAYVPGHAPPEVKAAARAAGARIVRGRYQAGLAAAVTQFLRHEPGSCAQCRPTGDRPWLEDVMAVAEQGSAAMAKTVVRLALEARKQKK